MARTRKQQTFLQAVVQKPHKVPQFLRHSHRLKETNATVVNANSLSVCKIQYVYWRSQTQACSHLNHITSFLFSLCLYCLQPRGLSSTDISETENQIPPSVINPQPYTAFNYLGCPSTNSNTGHSETPQHCTEHKLTICLLQVSGTSI